MYEELKELDEKHQACEKKVIETKRSHEFCQRLDEIIGPITATAIYAALGNGHDFENNLHFPLG